MKHDIQMINDKKEWNSFVFNHTSDTFHQSWEWGELYENLGNSVWRLAIVEKGIIQTTCLAMLVKAKRASFLLVPHGPIFSSTSCQNELESIVEKLIQIGKNNACSFIRVAPIVERTNENREIFIHCGFRAAPIFVQSELSLVLDITPTMEELLKGMRKTTRQIVKRAKDYNVEYWSSTEKKDFEIFYNLYSQTVHQQKYVGHNRRFIENEFNTFKASGESTLCFVNVHGRPVAGAMIIIQNNTGFYHYGASVRSDENVPAPHLLQWYIIQDLKNKGCVRYNFWGIAPEEKPSHPWRGLTVFKKGFGGTEKAYLETQDYILKTTYWFNWLIEKARKIKRGY